MSLENDARPGPITIWTDSWTLQDELNFTIHVEALQEVIETAATPLTVGIFGTWGSGKTSLMRMLRTSLSARLRSVWFDAWKYDREDAIWRALILRILDSLREEASSDEAAIKEIYLLEESLYRELSIEEPGRIQIDFFELSKALARATVKLSLSMIPGLSLAADLAKEIGSEEAALSEKLLSTVQRKGTETHRNHVRFLDQFQDRFGSLIDKFFVARGHRLVIFVDDLDRCLPPKALDVLESLKLFLDVPGCIFVLGLDRIIVESGIRQRFPAALNERPDSRPDRDYLDKIIQLPFYLPALSKSAVERYAKALLPGALETVVDCLVVGADRNPRKLKQVANTFFFLRALSERDRALAQEIDPELLLKVVIIQQRHRDTLYRDLLEYPNLLQELEQLYDRPGGKTRFQAGREESDAAPAPRSKAGGTTPSTLSWPDENSREDLAKRYLVDRSIRALLLAGQKRFSENQIGPYIYLIRATSPDSDPDSIPLPSDVIWQDLISGDPARIRKACDDIQLREDSLTYLNSLLEIVGKEGHSLEMRLSAGMALGCLGDPRLGQTVVIPSGAFPMGTRAEAFDHLVARYGESFAEKLRMEMPRISMDVPEFEMDVFPVTNKEYKKYVESTGAAPPISWPDGSYPIERSNSPVTGVDWWEASKYASWSGKRLPTEVEWEKAARGLDGREWPWGSSFDSQFCNSAELGLNQVVPVGILPKGVSPFGVHDMAGNVWEWTASRYVPYDRLEVDAKADDTSSLRVLRGGSYFHTATAARCAFRNGVTRDLKNEFIGFRCCR